jgi:glutamate dehydrogenase
MLRLRKISPAPSSNASLKTFCTYSNTTRDKKSWVPVTDDTLEDYTVKALTWEMEQFQRKSAERTVPWFLRNLPSQYFKEIERDLQRDHLRAMTALSEAGLATSTEEEAQKLCEFSAKGQLDRVKFLVSQGASPIYGDYDGRTPFHLAAAEGHQHILEYLKDLPGATMNVRDRWGNTPLTDARLGKHWDCVAWMEAQGAVEGDHPDCSQALQFREHTPVTTELMLKSRNRRYVTFFNADNKPETFRGLVNQINLEQMMTRAKGFVVKDGSMVVTVFEFGAPQFLKTEELNSEDNPAKDTFNYYYEHRHDSDLNLGSEQEFLDHVASCPRPYLLHTQPEAFFIHKRMIEEVAATGNAKAKFLENQFTPTDQPRTYWMYLISPNVFAHSEMLRFVNYLGIQNFNIIRFHMDQMKEERGVMVILRALVQPPPDVEVTQDFTRNFESTLSRLKYVDDDVLLAYERRFPEFTLEQCEILLTLGTMIYGPLNKDLPFAFTLDRLQQTIMTPEHSVLGKAISTLFMDKFNVDHRLPQDEYERRRNAIGSMIDETVQTNVWQRMFHKLLDAVDATYRTNLYLPNRKSLMLRINPEIMMARAEIDRERPYGVFFGFSRRCAGFHVRFREIARGGLRVVPCVTSEAFGLESTRHFDEVYGLASAQQLKNKDIPEGGSKAVLLVNTNDRVPGARDLLMRRCVQFFGDGLLDLITPDAEAQALTVDYWGKPELLYLGPDENIIPEDIVWLTERADIRGMKYPSAFMSSKPDAGINHKVYGVTSEGVAVFLQVALQTRGIDPFNESFTVKITGGPNGDVAGNMIKILRRDYGTNAKIVGMSDHSASVENPNGLDIEELYRLHIEDLALEHYDRRNLGEGGELHIVNTPEGTQKRNTMHNRLHADVFVPAGGRPNTINLLNWKHFMKEDGTPSSPLIVEAANIYITAEARKKLGEAGAMIVKDSSANKAGVCCSSYEIVASMLLNKEEFMAVKDELVDDVLERLRDIARSEAQLLFREAQLNPNVQMPDVAVKISKSITRVGDFFLKALDANFDILDEKNKYRLITESLPKKLVEVAGERLIHDLPPAYVKAMIAASLASKMVYAEGVDFVDSLDERLLAEAACNYLQLTDKIRNMMTEIESSDMENKEDIIAILRHAGARSALELKI